MLFWSGPTLRFLDGGLYNLGSNRTREAIRQACDRLGVEYYGTHGFRKGWAQETFQTLLAEGLDRREAGWQVSQALGHGRLDVLRHYLPSW